MDAQLNRKSLMFGVPGIVLQIAGNVMSRLADQPGASPNMGMLVGGMVVAIVGTVLLIYGLALYAKAKGYSGWLGLLGLLSCLGLIVLAVLPDKNK